MPSFACNVPVFRYALERWQPEPYQLLVYHRGPLTEAEETLVRSLFDIAERTTGAVPNVLVERIDLDKNPAEKRLELFQMQKSPKLPWLVVRYPQSANIAHSLYEGPLDAEVLRRLLDSPARRELARRILEGQSAVWLCIDSGDNEKDDANWAWLDGYLKKVQKEMVLPELTGSPKDALLSDVKLKLEFSMVRLSRQNPDEDILVQMLLGMEEDLAARKEPIVFPVFGRGLALYALVGKGINEANVEQTAHFIVGACKCEAKKENPGVDLLVTADWEGGLTGKLTKNPELPLAALTAGAQNPLPYGRGSDSTDGRGSDVWRNLLVIAGCGLLVLIAGTIVVLKRK
ncbi:MAG: hypothetical protein L0Y72_03345 [Gemmataceae bacterium]|nr:hypothetical protein [Gemmataceae bacterium]MCI0738053.1 hypothetical protein [Gemmataceae bacterium]